MKRVNAGWLFSQAWDVPVVCVKLDRVPGLSNEAKGSVRRWLQQNRSNGAHNVPRRFNDNKNVICTLISQNSFSKETRTALLAGTYT